VAVRDPKTAVPARTAVEPSELRLEVAADLVNIGAI
jgi:hypothetical protein